jgi:hypothetical protein
MLEREPSLDRAAYIEAAAKVWFEGIFTESVVVELLPVAVCEAEQPNTHAAAA